VRVARVAPVTDAAPQEYDADGWPVGGKAPPVLRARVRRALARDQSKRRTAPPGVDPCHGYPWYPRWTDRRLGDVVREIGADDAFDCLRRRLASERGWREAELRARVDPLRRTST
jgi:hypothetical protein